MPVDLVAVLLSLLAVEAIRLPCKLFEKDAAVLLSV